MGFKKSYYLNQNLSIKIAVHGSFIKFNEQTKNAAIHGSFASAK